MTSIIRALCDPQLQPSSSSSSLQRCVAHTRGGVRVRSRWHSDGAVCSARARELVSRSFTPLLREAMPCLARTAAARQGNGDADNAVDGDAAPPVRMTDYGGEWFWHGYQHALYGEDVLFDLRGTGVVLASDVVVQQDEEQQQQRQQQKEEEAEELMPTCAGSSLPHVHACDWAACHATNTATARASPSHAATSTAATAAASVSDMCAHDKVKVQTMHAVALSLVLHVAQQPLLENDCGPHALVLCATHEQCEEWSRLLVRFACALHLVVHNLCGTAPAMPSHRRAEIVVATPPLWTSALQPPTTTTATRRSVSAAVVDTATAWSCRTHASLPLSSHTPPLYTQHYIAQLVVYDVDTQVMMGYAALLGRVLCTPSPPARAGDALPAGCQVYLVVGGAGVVEAAACASCDSSEDDVATSAQRDDKADATVATDDNDDDDDDEDARCTRCVCAWARAHGQRCGAPRATLYLACDAVVPAAVGEGRKRRRDSSHSSDSDRTRDDEDRGATRPRHELCAVLLRGALTHTRLCDDATAVGEFVDRVVALAEHFYSTFDADTSSNNNNNNNNNSNTHYHVVSATPAATMAATATTAAADNGAVAEHAIVCGDGHRVSGTLATRFVSTRKVTHDGHTTSATTATATATTDGVDDASASFTAQLVYVCTLHACDAHDTITTTTPTAATTRTAPLDARVREVAVLLTAHATLRRAFPTRIALLCDHLADELNGELFDGNVVECVAVCTCALTWLPRHGTHVLLARSFATAPAVLHAARRTHTAATAAPATTAAATTALTAAWSPRFVRWRPPSRCPLVGAARRRRELRRGRAAAVAAVAAATTAKHTALTSSPPLWLLQLPLPPSSPQRGSDGHVTAAARRHRDDDDDAATSHSPLCAFLTRDATGDDGAAAALPCPRHGFTVVVLRNVCLSRRALCRCRRRQHGQEQPRHRPVTTEAAGDGASRAMAYVSECARYGRILSYYCHEQSYSNNNSSNNNSNNNNNNSNDDDGEEGKAQRRRHRRAATLFVEFAHYAAACEAVRRLCARAERQAQSLLAQLTASTRTATTTTSRTQTTPMAATMARGDDDEGDGARSDDSDAASDDAAVSPTTAPPHPRARLFRNTTYYDGVAQEMARRRRRQQHDGGNRSGSGSGDDDDGDDDDIADIALLDEA